jgi:hypothetical protein
VTPGAWAFLLLLGLALWTAGLTGYLIFGPLTYRHLQDRAATVGSSFVSPAFMRWLFLARGYRGTPDRNLSGLATPAFILGWCMWIGGVLSLVALPFKP